LSSLPRGNTLSFTKVEWLTRGSGV
jgi:hypothetical protein